MDILGEDHKSRITVTYDTDSILQTTNHVKGVRGGTMPRVSN